MQTDLSTLQQEVQRALGRCMFSLQQYERLMKQLVVAADMRGTALDFPAAQTRRETGVRTMTLGQLVGAFAGKRAILMSSAQQQDDGAAPEPATIDVPRVGMRWNIVMAPDDHARIVAGLKALVDMRNVLVHHFIDRFDLDAADGCAAALRHLDACHETIARHCRDVDGWAESMNSSRALARSVLESTALDDLFRYGFGDDCPAQE